MPARPGGTRMKVLHVFKTYFPDTQGGIEEVIRTLAGDTRVQATVLSLSPSVAAVEERSVDGVRLVRLPSQLDIASTPMTLRGLGTYRRLAATHDLLHFHFPWPFGDLLHLGLSAGRPAVVTYHSDVVRQQVLNLLYRPVMDRFLATMDRIVATSPDYLRTSAVLQAHAARVATIPLGIADGAAQPLPPGPLHPRPYFAFVGVLRYYKGLEYLLRAAQGAPWDLVVVGKGPEQARCAALASELGLDNVTLAGFRPDAEKFALMRDALGVVLPSHLRSEAFGVTLVEAAMMGKPLVSCGIGTGTSYVNEDGVTGSVVEPADPAALRRALDRLQADAVWRTQAGLAARARYERLFTAAAMRDAYLDLYRAVLARREAHP